MKDARGAPVGGYLFEWCAGLLVPVLPQRGDLKDLVGVMRAAAAMAEAHGTDIPEVVIDRFATTKEHSAEQLPALVRLAAIRRRLRGAR